MPYQHTHKRKSHKHKITLQTHRHITNTNVPLITLHTQSHSQNYITDTFNRITLTYGDVKCVCACVYMCVCVCVCKDEGDGKYTHLVSEVKHPPLQEVIFLSGLFQLCFFTAQIFLQADYLLEIRRRSKRERFFLFYFS